VARAAGDRIIAETALKRVGAGGSRQRLVRVRRNEQRAITRVGEIGRGQLAGVDGCEPQQLRRLPHAGEVGVVVEDDIGAVLDESEGRNVSSPWPPSATLIDEPKSSNVSFPSPPDIVLAPLEAVK